MISLLQGATGTLACSALIVLLMVAGGCSKDSGSNESDVGGDTSLDVVDDSDATHDVSSDAEAPTVNDACPCGRGHRCVDDVCQPVRMFLATFWHVRATGSVDATRLWPYACATKPMRDEALDERQVIARSDQCVAWRDPEDSQTADTHGFAGWRPGTPTVRGSDPSPLDMVFEDPCFTLPDTGPEAPPAISPGDQLTLSADASDDFPAFSHDFVMPAQPAGQVGDLEPGEPLALNWESGNSDEMLLSVKAYDPRLDTTVVIGCNAEDDGEFQMPGELTEVIADGAKLETEFSRRFLWHYEPEEAEVVIDILTESMFVVVE